ncbi:MAG: BfmA/BtgA family mobilization protein [Bacteroidota bacterium]
MDGFKSIRFKKSTVIRFRAFSKKMAKSYSECLESIMDFFEWHGLDPSKKFSKSIIQEILKNRQRTETSIKRNEATIAIIRDIEINQTKPNNAMLLALFGEDAKTKKPIRKERKQLKKKSKPDSEIEVTVPKIRYERLSKKLEKIKRDYGHVLDKVELVKGSFGKTFFRLELSPAELEKFKRTLKNNS